MFSLSLLYAKEVVTTFYIVTYNIKWVTTSWTDDTKSHPRTKITLKHVGLVASVYFVVLERKKNIILFSEKFFNLVLRIEQHWPPPESYQKIDFPVGMDPWHLQ